MNAEETTLKKHARLVGLLYLVIVIIAPIAHLYIPGKLMVSGDPTATARNIVDNEFLFRVEIFLSIVGQILFVFLVLMLFRLLKDVNRHLARLMSVLVIVGVPVSLLSAIFKITALMILKGSLLRSFDTNQIHDITALLFKICDYGGQVVQIVWGLWLIPFGLLVYRSGFIPRILGIFLILNGITYVILFIIFLLFPAYFKPIYPFLIPFLFLGEILITFWLLIKGIRFHGLKPPIN